METDMSANIPVLPIAGGTLVCAPASLLAIVTRWLKKLARTRRNNYEASTLASLDRRMLAVWASPVPVCATPFRSRSGKTRPPCCAAISKRLKPCRGRFAKKRGAREKRLPP